MKFPNIKNTLTTAAGVGGGVVLGQMAASKIPIGNDKLKSLIVIFLGGILAGKGKGMLHNVGIGVSASGAYQLIKSFVPGIAGEIAGYDEISGMVPSLNGVGSTYAGNPALHGMDEMSVAGMEDTFE